MTDHSQWQTGERIDLEKNIPWILPLCFPQALELWTSADSQGRLSKGAVQLMPSCPPFLLMHIETPGSGSWPQHTFPVSFVLFPLQLAAHHPPASSVGFWSWHPNNSLLLELRHKAALLCCLSPSTADLHSSASPESTPADPGAEGVQQGGELQPGTAQGWHQLFACCRSVLSGHPHVCTHSSASPGGSGKAFPFPGRSKERSSNEINLFCSATG